MHLEQLGPYRLGRKLGRGGMGTVYAAIEAASGAPAAVKVLSASLAQEEGFRDRFEAEIETLRKLRHPNIVRLFGFGEQAEVLFYVMELVEGTSLEEQLHAGRRFNWREVTQIGIKVCRALRHAHDHGVIHRDIKPANLLLSDTGEVKLSDFGIAKLFGNSSLTGDGSVIGTAEYMAPEQADGRPVTHRCDLYSLGGVLYALCAGRPPFRARTLPEMLQLQRFAEPEPLRRYAPDAPAELEQIVSELLAKEPEARIPTARVLARRLEAMEHGLSRRESRDHSATSGAATVVDERAEGLADSQGFSLADPDQPPMTAVTGADAGEAEFTVAPAAGRPGSAAALDLLVGTRASDAQSVPEAAVPRTDHLGETQAATGVAGEASPPAAQPAPVPPRPAIGGRFTHVDEADAAEVQSQRPPLISPQTWLLIVALLLLGLGAWYFLQPTSADTLYGRIVARADKDQIEVLLDAEPDIQTFLAHYPADVRGRKLRQYLSEIELYRLERRFQRRSRIQIKGESLSSIERAYLEATKRAEFDPEEGIHRLQAIVDLYQGESDLSAVDRQLLELARRQLEWLQTQVAASSDQDLALIRRELQRAARLHDTDPEAAMVIWRSLIELYANKPWAASEVAQARAALPPADVNKAPTDATTP